MVSHVIEVFTRLRRKYIYAFMLIFIFTILAQVIIQVYIHEQESKAHVINLAGKQRMLSQKISKSSLLLFFSSENERVVKSVLSNDLQIFKETHNDLKNGNKEKDVRGPFNESIKSDYLALDPYVERIELHSQCFLNNCKEQDLNIQQLTKNTNEFLLLMNALVDKSDNQIKESIQFLSLMEYVIFAIIAIIMLIEFFLVLLPFQRSLFTHYQHQLKEEAEKEKVYHMAEVGELTSEVLHEINNFMTVVRVATGIIKKKANGEVEKSGETLADNLMLINRIERNVNNIVTLSSGMLKMTRVDDIKLFPISDVVDEVKDVLNEKLQKGNVKLDISISENVQLENLQIKLTQVLFNLVKNAIHAVGKTEVKEIKLETLVEGDDLLIKVSDSGVGVPDDIAEKIMDPFFTTKGAGKGTGLGLSLSKRLAQNLGGELTLISNANPTTFQLRVKIKNLSYS